MLARPFSLIVLLVALVLAGCGPAQTPGPTIRPSGTGELGSPAVATTAPTP